MPEGYMGKILFVNLSTGEIKEETPDEKLYRDFIGGHGLGARVLYNRQKAGVDALGPENHLGLITGPLTGSPAAVGTRYQAVAKSPLTGGWGDANSGGHFGPHLKFGGFDAVFFTGISPKPVYLFIDNGKAEIRDAAKLWGKDNYDTEDTLKAELGSETEVVSIGVSGEKLSLISCLMNRRGCAAGRSGIGAVMGSKRLKAVAVRGDKEVPLADAAAANELRKTQVADYQAAMRGGRPWLDSFRKYGTSAMTGASAHSGDSPIKNWGGVGIVDYPDVSVFDADALVAKEIRKDSCWHCPIACEGILGEGKGEYKYPAGSRRVEYETQAAFGGMCLVTDPEAINMANDICNRQGLDTISGGTVIAFAMECYENGLITKEDTGGIELTWGNHRSMVAMTEMVAKREGFGDVLADGVKIAAERIGKDAERFAVHVGGQELGMHDPRFSRPGMPARPAAARYQMDATPGRHTAAFGPSAFMTAIQNAMGVCMFGGMALPKPAEYFPAMMKAVTGWDRSMPELLKCGERIVNMRHLFNLREGINELQWAVHPRIIGKPAATTGPLAGITADLEAQVYWNLGVLDWDHITTKPSKKKLLELGLDDVAKELWP
ncbi:MAG: aldehyde ferredoxin oxidoreductase family protein [Chloroflexota bacterium]